MPEEGTERGGCGDPVGGDWPQALRFGEVRPGHHDGCSGSNDGAPAGSMLFAKQTVIRLEQPGARTVKQVVEKRLGFVIAADLRDARVGLRRVPGLRAADCPDDPPNRGGPSVVASPVEGQAEEADLMQQRDGEFAGRRAPENSLTDGQVGRRVGSAATELVPCECNGRAPVEQVLTGELTAKTQRTVAEVALLLENGRGAMVSGPGTFRGKA